MTLDQLYFRRPTPAYCDYRSPIKGLYLCGSGAHPGKNVYLQSVWFKMQCRFKMQSQNLKVAQENNVNPLFNR